VLSPQPLGPMIATNFPRETLKLMSLMASRPVPGNPSVTFSKRRTSLAVVSGMVEFMMLPEDVPAIVISIQSADDGVNVVPRRLFVVEHDTMLMLEFDKYHRAVNPVVENICPAKSSRNTFPPRAKPPPTGATPAGRP
jgi:hypothetical protein